MDGDGSPLTVFSLYTQNKIVSQPGHGEHQHQHICTHNGGNTHLKKRGRAGHTVSQL